MEKFDQVVWNLVVLKKLRASVAVKGKKFVQTLWGFHQFTKNKTKYCELEVVLLLIFKIESCKTSIVEYWKGFSI